MKKILGILGAVGLTATLGQAAVSCSWNKPPISMATISQIMKIAKEQILKGSDGQSIPLIFGEHGKIDDWPQGGDPNTDFRNWSDPITGKIASIIATKPVEDNPGGLINQGKNILTGEVVDDWKNISGLKEMQSYHMTIMIADLAKIDGQKLSWISQETGQELEDFKIGEKTFPIDAQQITSDGSGVSKSGNYKIFKFLKLDLKNWKQLKEHKGDYRIRFLVKVAPKDTEPVLFYLDQVMEK